LEQRIAQNLLEVRQRIADAAERSGRAPGAVRLVAVTKYVGPDAIRALVGAGGLELGESRPQQLWQRSEELAGLGIRWHMIGHLQRNKVRRTLPVVELVHSIDSPDLLEAVDRIAGELSLRAAALVEVNVSGEESKDGLAPAVLPALLEQAARCRSVSIRGLMCMASLEGGPDVARANFSALRELRDRARAGAPDCVCLDELSMGMSGDFELAIEEGATIVRVGSALFEGIEQ
jgi:PLP dependent protein